jgi:hypothetical protein
VRGRGHARGRRVVAVGCGLRKRGVTSAPSATTSTATAATAATTAAAATVDCGGSGSTAAAISSSAPSSRRDKKEAAHQVLPWSRANPADRPADLGLRGLGAACVKSGQGGVGSAATYTGGIFERGLDCDSQSQSSSTTRTAGQTFFLADRPAHALYLVGSGCGALCVDPRAPLQPRRAARRYLRIRGTQHVADSRRFGAGLAPRPRALPIPAAALVLWLLIKP